MKVLITGSAGFIGSNLVDKLVDSCELLFGIDNINDYYDLELKYDRLKNNGINFNSDTKEDIIVSSKYKNYFFSKIDLCDLQNLKKIFTKYKFSHVIHLAAQAGVRYSIKNPRTYIKSNVEGFFNIIDLSKIHNIKHLIYASSSSVYGNRTSVPFFENDNVNSPESLYAATKVSNEMIAHSYSKIYNLNSTGLRFFTVYGPWGRPDMAPFLFADAIINKKEISVFNNGDMLRDFTYIDDIVSGIITVLNKSDHNKSNQILNIGFGNPVNLLEFIKILEKEIGEKALINFLPMQKGDVKKTWANVDKLNNLGYKPSIKLDEGISRFIFWFKNYYNV